VRAPLYLGQLNDGIEADYPTTDVPALLPFVHVLLGVELDRDLDDQKPNGWWAIQAGSVGIAGSPLLALESSYGMPLSTWQKTPTNLAVVTRVDYRGCPLSLISCKRPGKAHADTWPTWDANLAALVKAEERIGQVPGVGLDTNEADPKDLAAQVGLAWHAPTDTSMVGLLLSPRLTHLATTSLPATGEHAPVVSVVRAPVTT
jgi:hypothetical protein